MKKLYVILLLAVGIFAAYWIAYGVNPLKKLFGGGSASSSTGTSSGTSAATGTTTGTSSSVSPNAQPAAEAFLKTQPAGKDSRGFPLSVGSTGQYVKMIQQALNDRFGSELVVDGILGSKTAKALGAHGYNADAIYYKHFNEIVGYQYWK